MVKACDWALRYCGHVESMGAVEQLLTLRVDVFRRLCMVIVSSRR